MSFSTLIDIVAETAIVSFHTLPVGFPLPTISKNSLSTLFYTMILDHGACFKISAPKILISNFLLCLYGVFFSSPLCLYGVFSSLLCLYGVFFFSPLFVCER